MKTIYREGQTWAYKHRLHEPQSTLTIFQIDQNERLGPIFHIAISNLQITNPNDPSKPLTGVGHAPVTREVLDQSVAHLIGGPVAINSSSLRGYEQWKKAFDEGNAGVFTIPVAEIVAAMEQGINQGQAKELPHQA